MPKARPCAVVLIPVAAEVRGQVRLVCKELPARLAGELPQGRREWHCSLDGTKLGIKLEAIKVEVVGGCKVQHQGIW